MRIISGSLKGKSIDFIKNSNTRPLKDSVKENIFNILNHSHLIKAKIENSEILDLYSGIGSFGVECISRGAKKVTFVEQNKNAASILENNLTDLSILKKANIFTNKVENTLEKNKKNKFDIFFFDPPFANKSFIKNLYFIKNNTMYKKKHILIIHRERKSKDNLEKITRTIKVKKYGRSKIIFANFN